MKNKIKYSVIILAVLLCSEACTTASKESQVSPNDVKVESTKNGTKADQTAEPAEEKATGSASKEEKTVALWKDKYCTISYKGMDISSFGMEVKLYAENIGKKNIAIQVQSMTIDDFTIDPVCSIDINSGKKANDSITVFSNQLEENGIDAKNVKKIEVQFRVVDLESFDNLDVSDTIQISVT